MGITGKSKTSNSSNSSSSEKWGMGLLLVFFSDDDAIFNKKKNSFSSSSSSTSPITNFMRRTNSNLILTKTQSTISICALLVFITFLLFTLSTFEPTVPYHDFTPPRRILNSYPQNTNPKPTIHSQNPPIFSSWVSKIWENKLQHRPKINPSSTAALHALQGMGTLFLRGTRAMNDLIVVHAMEEVVDDNGNRMRMFMRLLHRSGLTSKADIVFLFPSTMDSSVFHSVIREENDFFLDLVRRYRELNDSVPSFDVTQYVKKEKDTGEPIWGKKIRGNNSNNSDGETQLIRYGSVVGFDSDELDPENSLSGFFDHVPLSLKRWACYPMLLGRVRRNYKHIMLVDMKNILLLGDPLGRVRNRSPDSVFLYSALTKHARKNSDKTRQANSAVVLGGARGVRRLSNVMLTEIVRSAMQQHKGKHSLTESCILNQLFRNEFILKDSVNFITAAESIPDASSLTGLNRNTSSSLSLSRFTVVQRGNSNNNNAKHGIDSVIMKHICSFEVDSSVYRDCEQQEKIKEMKL